MNNQINTNSISNTGLSKEGNQLILCPYCMQGIPIFDKTIINGEYCLRFQCKCNNQTKTMKLSEYLSKIKHPKPQQCSFESRPALKYCADCSKCLCQECLMRHKEFCFDHMLFDCQLNIACLKHKRCFTHYCSTCKVNICKKCQSEHETHQLIVLKIEDIKEFDNEMKQLMKQDEEEFAKIDDKIKPLENKLNALKRQKEVLLAKINGKKELECLVNDLISTARMCEKYPTYELIQDIKAIKELNSQVKEYEYTKVLKGHTSEVRYILQFSDGILASCS